MADDRLSYADLRGLVCGLSTPILRQLAEGPLPGDKDDGYDCRVCMVLGGRAAVSPPAAELKRWHEFFDDTGALDTLLKASTDHQAKAEWKRIAGELSYARCTTIYALAETELVAREVEQEPQRDADERRQDEEAEDAERRLDAEKIGDL